MTNQERIAQLEAKNVAKNGRIAHLQEQVATLEAQVQHLLLRLAKERQHRSKPPSSDGPRRRPRSQRMRGERKTGGHLGHSLAQIAVPAGAVLPRPTVCSACQGPLDAVASQMGKLRQVLDLPKLQLVVTNDQVEAVRYPQCQQVTRGAFLPEVSAPAHFSQEVRALAIYLNQYQLRPEARTCETLADRLCWSLSDGTLAYWVQEAAERLMPTGARIADLVAASRVQHADETGGRLAGKAQWLHGKSTPWLTHRAWPSKRVQPTLSAIGLWPGFQCWAIHDRCASYEHYACLHSRGKGPLLRDLTFLAEERGHGRAAKLKPMPTGLHTAVMEWQGQEVRRVPSPEREDWLAQNFELLAWGSTAQAPPAPACATQRRGRRKQSPAKNRLDVFLHRAEQVLAFIEDGTVPCITKQAEQVLRLAKVQQKSSGTFRSPAGAMAFCRIRSYLSTMRTQGQAMVKALRAVMRGRPLPVIWGI